MVKKNKIQIISMEKDMVLSSINRDDLELLRKWKNANRESFFHKEIITKSDQEKWYNKYASSENYYIFMILYENTQI